jgi:glucuronosyltransferase
MICRYSSEAKRLSVIARDEPKSPVQRAVFWTEYVIRHKGAKHLRPAGEHLNWFQLHSLDVVSFLLAVLIISFWILIRLSKKMCGSYLKTQKKQKTG